MQGDAERKAQDILKQRTVVELIAAARSDERVQRFWAGATVCLTTVFLSQPAGLLARAWKRNGIHLRIVIFELKSGHDDLTAVVPPQCQVARLRDLAASFVVCGR